ncbi:BP74-related protein [Allokutzneria albata]|uniref:BP74 N-terminal domain-containing protein n=1 Tax=Allokutzneria albata TaxID=211114 RepID=A0A1G9V417_ALLAB|nr:hypothetical protein SAMN04489726_2813 [Allokutzneria albata]
MFVAAYFAFRQQGGREFVFQLTCRNRIAHARRILAGEEREKVNVFGRIILSAKPYNPGWSYHLEPDSVQFFAAATERKIADVLRTGGQRGEVSGIFLPGGYWFPRGSRVLREVRGF